MMRAILTYHSIDPSGSPISCHPAIFESHARWFASGRVRVVTLENLLTLPESVDALAITFDDAFVNFRDAALPVLRAHGLPSTVFVVSGRTGLTNAWRGVPDAGIPVLPLLDWTAIAALSADGVTIGSHSRTHGDLTRLAPSAVEDELQSSARMIENETGRRPTAFAYPYGAVDSKTAGAVAKVYRHACTTEFRGLEGATDLIRLPRLDAYYFGRPQLLDAWGTSGFTRFVARRRRIRRVGAATRQTVHRMLSWGAKR